MPIHQDKDVGKTYSELLKMRSYWRSCWKYSKATICRRRNKDVGDLVVNLRSNNQGRPPKLSVQGKRNILQKTKCLQEEMGNFSLKKIMVKAGVPVSISEKIDCSILQEADLKRTSVQRTGI